MICMYGLHVGVGKPKLVFGAEILSDHAVLPFMLLLLKLRTALSCCERQLN